MKKPVLYLLLAAVLFTSCATASLSKYRGVGRIKQYDFYSYDVPSAFKDCNARIALSRRLRVKRLS